MEVVMMQYSNAIGLQYTVASLLHAFEIAEWAGKYSILFPLRCIM